MPLRVSSRAARSLLWSFKSNTARRHPFRSGTTASVGGRHTPRTCSPTLLAEQPCSRRTSRRGGSTANFWRASKSRGRKREPRGCRAQAPARAASTWRHDGCPCGCRCSRLSRHGLTDSIQRALIPRLMSSNGTYHISHGEHCLQRRVPARSANALRTLVS
jgi:hypothetical protein